MSSVLDKDIGDTLEIGASTLDVVGVVDDSTALAGRPNVFLTVEGAQAVMFAGQPLHLVDRARRASPATAPAGYKVIDRDDAIDDILRPLEGVATARSRSSQCCSGSSRR